MVTIASDVKGRKFPYEFYGKSTDVKPTEKVLNGSTFYEMDTKTVYMFDEEDGVWLKQ